MRQRLESSESGPPEQGDTRDGLEETFMPGRSEYNPTFEMAKPPRGFTPVRLNSRPAPGRLIDRHGLMYFQRADGKWVDHPTLQGEHFFRLLQSWQVSGDETYRIIAVRQAERMRHNLERFHGALWAIYDMPLRHQGESLPRPWVSAFGQQRVMGVGMAMYRLTQDEGWLSMARDAFRALVTPRDHTRPGLWVSAKDSSGYLWFEGFPRASGKPTMTYNIHLTALYGLAGMYTAPFGTGHTETVRELVQAGMATAAHYALSVRNKNQCSFYYGNPRLDATTNKFYHAANVGAMRTIHQRTGYQPIADAAAALARDFPVSHEGGRLFMKAGTYYLRKIWASDHDDGKVWKVVVKKDSRRHCDRREGARAGGAAANPERRTWLRLTGQPWNGWWVNEEPGKAFLEGFDVDRLNFHPPVEIRFRAGKRIRGVSRYPNGWERARTAVHATFKRTGRARVDTIATVQGRQEARVIDGPFKGKWVAIGNDVWLGEENLG